jgi:hypothetical protein
MLCSRIDDLLLVRSSATAATPYSACRLAIGWIQSALISRSERGSWYPGASCALLVP